MKYTIVGLFESQNQAKGLSAELEYTGIKNEDYIIYKTNRNSSAAQKQVFWKKLLGIQKPQQSTDDKLITSVAVYSDTELQEVKNTFAQNQAVKIYEFKDMSIEEAKDLDYIKKIVSLRAKSHIYAMPAVSVSRGNISEGINTQVKS